MQMLGYSILIVVLAVVNLMYMYLNSLGKHDELFADFINIIFVFALLIIALYAFLLPSPHRPSDVKKRNIAITNV